MRVHPQFILERGTPAFVILSISEYERILEKLEEIEDIKAVEASLEQGGERFPLELVEKIAAGENPIKTFREFRNISQSDLAKMVKVSRQYISQIEHGTRKGSTSILKKIAKALRLDLVDIV